MTLTETLLNYLHPYFEHKKYLQGEKGVDFLRSTNFGHSCIQMNKSEYADGLMVSFHLGIRNDLLESSLNSFLNQEKLRYDGITSLIVNTQSIARTTLNDRNRYFCTTEKEVKNLADKFIDFMDREGFDFLTNYKSIEKIDRLYNDHPEKSAIWCHHSFIRCFRGMTTAKLLNRADYESLFEMHKQYLDQRGFKGAILQKFNTTFGLLKGISLN